MKSIIQLSTGLAALAVSGLALAHPGHEAAAGLAAGFAHPFTGLDHLLAMLAVGLWAVQSGGRPLYAMPLAFVAAMLAGALLGMSGTLTFAPAAVESMIAASVLVLGLLVALRARVGIAAAAVLVSGFALFHGAAHGSEMVLGSGAASAYICGFVLATLSLHMVGIAIGRILQDSRVGLRAAGLPIVLAGVAFMTQPLLA
jgi:urease accessory protein